jgi:hypothetical protein
MRQGISSKISENHIYFGLGLYRLPENKCGRLLKFCAEIGSLRPILAGNGPAYLCKGKINERNFGISIIMFLRQKKCKENKVTKHTAKHKSLQRQQASIAPNKSVTWFG